MFIGGLENDLVVDEAWQFGRYVGLDLCFSFYKCSVVFRTKGCQIMNNLLDVLNNTKWVNKYHQVS